MTALSNIDIILTCRLGMERVVASYVKELSPEVEVYPAPFNLMGMVLVANVRNKYGFAEEIKRRIPEVEKAFVVEAVARADIPSIVETSKSLVRNRIAPNESFAVRTTRRGKHGFTSIDVNVAVGAAVKEVTGARVDLENPDKVVVVQIVHDYAYLSIVPGSEFYRKMKPYKFPMYKIFWRFVVGHEPYLGPVDASYTMGTRIGREVQTYEVGELVITPIGSVDANTLYHFLRGVFEGIESRYEVQKRSYGREVRKVRVSLQDMHQFVRSHIGEPLIVFEPEGEPISRVAREVAELIINTVKRGRKVYLMVGAREGVPTGIFRYASYVIDVAPGIVISTDYALASALIAISTAIHEKLVAQREELDEYLERADHT